MRWTGTYSALQRRTLFDTPMNQEWCCDSLCRFLRSTILRQEPCSREHAKIGTLQQKLFWCHTPQQVVTTYQDRHPWFWLKVTPVKICVSTRCFSTRIRSWMSNQPGGPHDSLGSDVSRPNSSNVTECEKFADVMNQKGFQWSKWGWIWISP